MKRRVTEIEVLRSGLPRREPTRRRSVMAPAVTLGRCNSPLVRAEGRGWGEEERGRK